MKLPGAFHLFFILIVILSSFRFGPTECAGVVQYCWSGTEDDMSGWRNMSCVTRETTLGNMASRSIPDGNTTTTPAPSALTPRSYYCMAFQYNESKIGENDSKITNFNAEYTCDFENYCEGRAMLDGYKFRYKGKAGILHCCNSENNCNTHQLIYKREHQQTCYIADLTSRSIRIDHCPNQKSFCMRNITKRYVGDSLLETISEIYSCDINDVMCGKLHLNESENTACKEFQNGDTETNICCCKGDNCYKPAWGEVDSSGAATNENLLQNGWQKTMLIIIGVALGILVVGVSLFFIMKYMRNSKKTGSPIKQKHYSTTSYRVVTMNTGGDDDRVQILSAT